MPNLLLLGTLGVDGELDGDGEGDGDLAGDGEAEGNGEVDGEAAGEAGLGVVAVAVGMICTGARVVGGEGTAAGLGEG